MASVAHTLKQVATSPEYKKGTNCAEYGATAHLATARQPAGPVVGDSGGKVPYATGEGGASGASSTTKKGLAYSKGSELLLSAPFANEFSWRSEDAS